MPVISASTKASLAHLMLKWLRYTDRTIASELDKEYRNERPLEQEICSIGGSVVECSPATRAARVRFPADASF